MEINDASDLPRLINIMIENAQNNCSGCHGNRYSTEIMKIAMYFYIRGGKHLYEFLYFNLNLPALKTTQRNMLQHHKKLKEGYLYFDELENFLLSNNFEREVCVMEDGTKITEAVEYDAVEKVLLGLVSPLDNRTGMPSSNAFPARSAKQIIDAIKNNSKATYVQIILAKSSSSGIFLYFSQKF